MTPGRRSALDRQVGAVLLVATFTAWAAWQTLRRAAHGIVRLVQG